MNSVGGQYPEYHRMAAKVDERFQKSIKNSDGAQFYRITNRASKENL
jgi:hypothetical protein